MSKIAKRRGKKVVGAAAPSTLSLWGCSVTGGLNEFEGASQETLVDDTVFHHRFEAARSGKPKQRQLYTHFLVIDFEASGHDRDSRTWEIVEFPCVVVEAATGKVVSEFHRYVRPTARKDLSAFCIEQCGISQATVDAADTIAVVLRDFVAWVDGLQLPPGAFAAVTCGNYDLNTALPAEVINKSLAPLPVYLKRWVNLKAVFAAYAGLSRQKGMAGMLQTLRLPLAGRHHSGIDDSRNIAAILQVLLEKYDRPILVTGCSPGLATDEPE